MKYLLLSLLILFSATLNAQDLLWAKAFYTNSMSTARSVAVDNSGNVYVTGSFRDTIDLDPGSGTHNVISTSIDETFIVKLDINGNFVWGKQLSGNQNAKNSAGQILLDNAGGILIAGYFTETVDFDPSQNTFSIDADSTDFFILKLDQDGNFNWAKKIGGIHDDHCYRMVIDHSGNICLTGTFKGTVDFDPGAGVHDITAISPVEVFVLKLDSQGNYEWADAFGGTNHANMDDGITVDINNNIYIAITHLSQKSLRKYDPGGTVLWTKDFGSITSQLIGFSIATDANGSVFGTGRFSGTVDFDPGVGVNDLVGNTDVFIVKLNTNGDFTWAKKIGGMGNTATYDIQIDNEDEIYLCGSFSNTVDFDPGIDTVNLTALSSTSFILKLNNNGDFKWVGQIGGHIVQLGLDIAGNVYAVGAWNGTVDLNPSETEVYNFTTLGTWQNGFMIKLASTLSISTIERKHNIIVSPNPTTRTINISSDATIEQLNITDITGKLIHTSSPNAKEHQIDLEVLPGIYYMTILSDNNSYSQKIMVVN